MFFLGTSYKLAGTLLHRVIKIKEKITKWSDLIYIKESLKSKEEIWQRPHNGKQN